MSTTQIITASAVTALTLTLAYAIYFDHKRRHDPEFRKSIAREKKKHRKAQKDAEDAESENRKAVLKDAVEKANEEGYPTEVEDREMYFMNEVAMGEQLLNSGKDKEIEAAICFYKALKVYPDPKNLVQIYEKTVPKNVLDILAEAIAYGDAEMLSEAVE